MVVVDARPTQNEHRHRGIGRYVLGTLASVMRLDPRGVALLVHGDRELPHELAGGKAFVSRRPHALRYHGGWIADELLLPIMARRNRWRLFHATDPNAVPEPRLVPSVVTAYDLTPLHDRAVWRAMTRDQQVAYKRMLRNLQGARGVVAISDTVRHDVAGVVGIPLERIEVVYPGIDPLHWAPPTNTQRSGLLFVGAPGENKNIGGLLQALALVKGAPPLTIVGPWPDDAAARLHRQISTNGLDVRLEPFASEARLRLLYHSSELLVMPSRHEGFGLPLLEAMASGCPAIISDAPALMEVAAGAARVVNADDIEGFASAIAGLTQDHMEQERLAMLGRRRAAQFTWDASARAQIAFYERLIS